MRFKPSVVAWRGGRQVLWEDEVETAGAEEVRAFDTPLGTMLFGARREIVEACRTVVRVNSLRAAHVFVLGDGTVVAGPAEGRAWAADGAVWTDDAGVAELARRIGMPVRDGVPARWEEEIRTDGLFGGPVAAALREALMSDAERVELWPPPHAAEAVA